ncbi:hypothetical protein M409DRAFT_63135 [Zasmidium cellare ATCC 36951]|uniref:Thioredoxin-like fold domain-containing protein n=1 Tax=Zasmidium cellare ATCC 36951 TaxID=1080233 RepID=A0A6A6D0B9_ZASCE|nr:uncharacterized protein M409DRAFT_63135 [Zasmidium cellare ATCC 36951]KAF2172453.1 hypothetical protein M409DRAFT_63135 [Zasmidium cellare ATCC 36951]
MPDDDKRRDTSKQPADNAPSRATTPGRSIFALPAPLKRIFDQFPLVTYDANELPERAPKTRNQHVLHVFTNEKDAIDGRPSFNPGCLKWQTYLRFFDIPFRTVPSSNHASPSGMLPFLQPAVSTPETINALDPIPSNKLKKWLVSQKTVNSVEESADIRYEAYASLLDNRIRKAWLYQLYLEPRNSPLVKRLYIAPCSSQPLVQKAIAHQLRSAAALELEKSAGSNVLSALDLLNDAEEAFQTLADSLGQDQWFFGQKYPGLFDASVFAYAGLILDEAFGWKHNPLQELLSKHENLVDHRNRVTELYY